MNYYLKLIGLLVLFSFQHEAQAGYCYSLGDGNWDDTTNWSCGRIPGSGDTIIVSVGDTLYCETSYNGMTGCWLQIYGWLDFKNACRYVWEYGDTNVEPSMITFYAGSGCINGNGSSGLSFGSGGSGCDVYRPASGANAGVYPTIPGSYYDGCVWASYLPVRSLLYEAEIVDQQFMAKWELDETPDIQQYKLFGELDAQQELLGIIDAINQNGHTTYDYTHPALDYKRFNLVAVHTDESSEILFSLDRNHLLSHNTSYTTTPNPFDGDLRVSYEEAFSIKLYGSDGHLIYSGEGEENYRIETSELPPGFYILRAMTEYQQLEQRKLIKR